MASKTDGAPLMAATMRLGMCPHCDAIHIIFLDEDGEEIAVGTITPDQWAMAALAVDQEQQLRADATGIGPVMGRA